MRIAMLLCCAAIAAATWSASASAAEAVVHPYLSSFGSFFNVQGVATDASGDVYVFDAGVTTIFKFDAAGNPVNFASTGTNEIAGVFAGGGSENEIAVDNSTGPAAGDIYVANGSSSEVKIFSPDGSPLGTLTPEEGIPWSGEACGVAVDPSGSVYVGVFSGQILKYAPTANPVTNANYSSAIEGAESPCNIAVDQAGSVFSAKFGGGPVTRYEPSQFGSSSATGSIIDSEGSTLAVDPANQELYVDKTGEVAQFGTHGEQVSTFADSGEGAIGGSGGSFGIAVGPVNHEIYVSNGSGQLSVFGTDKNGHIPTVTTGSATEVVPAGATLNGTVNPEEAPIGECFFEYGESAAYGKTVPCAESPGEIGSGNAPVAVHAEVTGLVAPSYHFRLVASQTVRGFGGDSSFAALLPPTIEHVYATSVTSTSATLRADLNPRSNETTYHFEYGTDASYGASSPAGHMGASAASTPVGAVHLEGLTADATYHYRLVATSIAGTTDGPDLTFTTESVGGPLTLLDGRQWELVSPPVKHGADIHKEGVAGGQTIVQAAASGDAISYVSENSIEEEPAGNVAPEHSQEISRRGTDGTWSTRTLNLKTEETYKLPIGTGSIYWLFNPELTFSVLIDYSHTPLSADATDERGPYLRDEAACNEGSSSCFTPFLTRANTKPGVRWDNNPAGGLQTRLADATADLKYTVISSEVPLTEGAETAEPGQEGLYEWSEGHLENVSINVAGKSVAGKLGSLEEADTRGAISSDGSRVFWCEISCFGSFASNQLLVRDTKTEQTARIDQATDRNGEFQIASEDGSRVFYTIENPGEFTNPQLWECTLIEVASKLECERSEVAPEVEGEAPGISADGTTVYFVSNKALVAGAEAGGNNLYVSHLENGEWVPRLIAALDPSHVDFEGDTTDWGQPNNSVESMTTRVSPNGRYLAFMSDRSLTGYDNRDAISGESDEEAFLYDDQDHKLICASCSKSGARPEGKQLDETGEELLIDSHGVLRDRWIAADIPAWESSASNRAVRQPRYLSNEGRLFFNSEAPLVPQDSNGLADVYEYEPEAVGSCADAGGCVQLISSGTSGEESTFVEASESGGDVFFMTSAKLAAQDTDTEYDIYDAHICTVASPCVQPPATLPPPCNSGEGCKAAPTPQPSIFGAPPSATFAGAGNLVQPAAKAKPLTRAQQLAKALKACRKDKSKSKRSSCEKQARERYGPKPKAKAKAKAKSHKAKAHKGGK